MDSGTRKEVGFQVGYLDAKQVSERIRDVGGIGHGGAELFQVLHGRDGSQDYISVLGESWIPDGTMADRECSKGSIGLPNNAYLPVRPYRRWASRRIRDKRVARSIQFGQPENIQGTPPFVHILPHQAFEREIHNRIGMHCRHMDSVCIGKFHIAGDAMAVDQIGKMLLQCDFGRPAGTV